MAASDHTTNDAFRLRPLDPDPLLVGPISSSFFTNAPRPDNQEEERPLARLVDPKQLRECRERYGEPRAYAQLGGGVVPAYEMSDIDDMNWGEDDPD